MKDGARAVLGLIELCPTQTVFLISRSPYVLDGQKTAVQTLRKESDLGNES